MEVESLGAGPERGMACKEDFVFFSRMLSS